MTVTKCLASGFSGFAVFTKNNLFYIVVSMRCFISSFIYSFHTSTKCTNVQEKSGHFYNKLITVLVQM